MTAAARERAPDPVEDFLARLDGSRAERVHEAVSELRARLREGYIVLAELLWEVKLREHWEILRKPDGSRYGGFHEYAQQHAQIGKNRIYTCVKIGRCLHRFPIGSRHIVRGALASVGITRAAIIARAIRSLEDVPVWVAKAKSLDDHGLREARASVVGRRGMNAGMVERIERGRVHRARRLLREFKLDHDLIDRFLAVGAEHVGGTPHDILRVALEDAITLWRSGQTAQTQRGPS